MHKAYYDGGLLISTHLGQFQYGVKPASLVHCKKLSTKLELLKYPYLLVL